MRTKLLLLFLVPLLLVFPVKAQTIICYNVTENSQNITVCNTTSTFVEENDNNLDYLFKVFTSSYKEENINTLDYLFKIFTSTFKEENKNNLAYLFKIFLSEFVESNYNPSYTIPGYNITPGQIKIVSEQAQIGDSRIKYLLIFPEYGAGYKYRVECYLNGTLSYTKEYENVKPGTNITDYCIMPILEKGYYNITVKFYSIYTAQQPPIETLMSEDTKLVRIVHYPFELSIEEPKNQTYKKVELEIIYSVKTAPTNGITYIIESILKKGNGTVWSSNDTLPAGIIGTYSYTLTFGQAGTYTLYAKLYALYHNTTLVDILSDNVTFTISEEAFGGGGGGVSGGGGGITVTPVTPSKPKLNITQNLTYVPKEEKPTGAQSVIEIFRQQPWLIIIVVTLIAFTIMMTKRK